MANEPITIEQLKAHLASKGLTQSECSIQLGLSFNTVAHWITIKRVPRLWQKPLAYWMKHGKLPW